MFTKPPSPSPEEAAQPALPRVYQPLLQQQNLAVDDAVLAALYQLEKPFQMAALRLLLWRGHPEVLVKLLEQYDRLPEYSREVFVGAFRHLEGQLRDCLRATNEVVRLNAIDIIRRARSYEAAYLLALGLRSPSTDTRARSATALRELAVQWPALLPAAVSPNNPEALADYYQLLNEHRQQLALLIEALYDALDSYEAHSRSSVIESALQYTLELNEQLLNVIQRPQSKCRRTIIEHLTHTCQPQDASFLLLYLQYAELEPTVQRIFRQHLTPELWSALLEISWLAGDPQTAAGLRSITQLPWLENNQAALYKMPTTQLRQALRLIRHSRISDEQKLQWYKNILLCNDPAKQQLAFYELVHIPGEASSDILRVMLDWSTIDLARVAWHELVRRYPEERPLLEKRYPQFSDSAAHSRPRRSAPIQTFADFWKQYDQLPDAQQRSFRELFQSDRAAIKATLTSHYQQGTAAERLRVLNIMRQWELSPPLREVVYLGCHDSDAMVRSAAVRQLAHLEAGLSEQLLLQALDDPDRRVRANAVDALDAVESPRRFEKLVPKLQDPDHRVRAGAIKALLRLRIRDAAVALLNEMRSESRADRASALWVAESLNLVGIIERIATMAEQDPDAQVRLQAQKLLRYEKRRQRRLRHTVQLPTDWTAPTERSP
ncbi:MAG: hypothetical protein HJJLKODD_02649 [Phycisphaerae bacterium]|nr:hypothetical protein [Phycisphaerae bacterium]